MSFICKNGTPHTHDTVEESKYCWGILRRPAPAPVPVAGPPRPYSGSECATGAQIRYVELLGGDSKLATSMNKKQCSEYIDSLKKGGARAVSETPPPRQERVSKVPPELLKMVRPGRYAVRADSAHPYVFVRISIAKSGQYKDAIKVQTQHSERLSNPKLVIWPSGKISLYDVTIEEPLLLVIADQQGSARAYAKELGRCARCGVELTDEQSRKWGVGPECVKHWPHMAVLAAEEEAG